MSARRWLLAAALLGASVCARAQAPEGTMTQAEIESLRDAAYIPMDRVRAYMKIMDDRQKELDRLMAGRHGADFGSDVHDVMDQMGAIADELNDNLDSYSTHHRDIRKVLPRLVQSTERWSTALRTPADDSRYNVVRKVALDALKDTRALAEELETGQEAYFKEHPDAAKAEKERRDNPHAPQ